MFLRISNNRKSAYVKIGLTLTEDELESALSAKPAARLLTARRLLNGYNQKLEQIRVNLLLEGRKDEDVKTIRTIVEESFFQTPSDEDSGERFFCRYFQSQIEQCRNAGYRKSREYTLNKIRDTYPDADSLTFEDISLKWLTDFDRRLSGQGASQNTRVIHFKNIRTVINRAIDDELTDSYPFRRFKMRQEATRKRSLPVGELRRLFTCGVERHQEFYRDMFKLIFCLIGINVVDLHGLKEISPDGRVEYRRAKTHRLYSVKVEPEAMEIIERWRGVNGLTKASDRWIDHNDFKSQLNKALKRIGDVRIAGRGGKKEITPYWPEISSYWARHSWATIAYELDIPKDVISQALGHSSGLDVTEVYINRDQRKVDEANRRVLDWVFYGKR